MNYSFDKEHAKLYGVDEAIMIYNFTFWIQKNKANKKHFYDGRYWTYNSVDAFKELFEFWTAKQLRRIIESLVNQNIIMRGNYNKSNIDRTGWYAFVNEDAFLGIVDLTKKANALDQKGEPLPYSNTDSKQTLPIGNDAQLPFQEIELKQRRKKFIKPTIDEIKLIIKDKKIAQKFFNHYEGNGWMVGKTKMVDWKATANNWIIDSTETHDNTNTSKIIL